MRKLIAVAMLGAGAAMFAAASSAQATPIGAAAGIANKVVTQENAGVHEVRRRRWKRRRYRGYRRGWRPRRYYGRRYHRRRYYGGPRFYYGYPYYGYRYYRRRPRFGIYFGL